MYHTKYVVDGSIDRYKEHLVAKVFSQVEGIDYFETFSPITKMNSIHLVLSLIASQGWTIFQIDVKRKFLHRDIHEEIYMEQPQGFM